MDKAGRMIVTGVLGEETRYRYRVRVTIGKAEFGAVGAVATGLDRVLIGRDLINLWRLVLDGQNEAFDIDPWSMDPRDISVWP